MVSRDFLNLRKISRVRHDDQSMPPIGLRRCDEVFCCSLVRRLAAAKGLGSHFDRDRSVHRRIQPGSDVRSRSDVEEVAMLEGKTRISPVDIETLPDDLREVLEGQRKRYDAPLYPCLF